MATQLPDDITPLPPGGGSPGGGGGGTPTPSAPILNISSPLTNFIYTENSNQIPSPTDIVISNTGGGTTMIVNYYFVSGSGLVGTPSWLDVSLSGINAGSSPVTLHIAPNSNVNLLQAGTYNVLLAVTGYYASNTPQNLLIRLVVAPNSTTQQPPTASPVPVYTTYDIIIQSKLPIPSFSPYKIVDQQTVVINPIKIPLAKVLLDKLISKIGARVDSFFDQDRHLKTILNFGNDYHSLITNWAYLETSQSIGDVAVKLYTPLASNISKGTPVFISREKTYPIIDKVYVTRAPDKPILSYLRPANRNSSLTGQFGNRVGNVTLQTLLNSGAFNSLTPSDTITERWYTDDFHGAELNIDYSDFNNFVFFGSAEKRLTAFKNKLLLLEQLNSIILQNSASISAISSGAGLPYSATLPFYPTYELSTQKIEILQSFDGYERFLYYDSGSEYSSSLNFNYDDDDEIPYYIDATWPKLNGAVISVVSASTWFNAITSIAQKYDLQNQNRFVNNLPEYIVNDIDSSDYIKFFDLVGHMFDGVKIYIDDLTEIYNRDSSAIENLSMDMVWEVAKGFGIDIPNQYALESLFNYAIGKPSGSSSVIYREAAAETWKRFLHNHILLMKTKGTRTSLNSLLNTFGILPHSMRVRETSTPSYFYPSSSYEVIEEVTNALIMNSGSLITIPIASSGVKSLYVRVSPSIEMISSSITSRDLFGSFGSLIGRFTKSGSYTKFEIVSGSGNVPILSSSYFVMKPNEFYNIAFLDNGLSTSSLYFNSTDITTTGSINKSTLSAASNIFVGRTSIISSSFDGYIDELRGFTEILLYTHFLEWCNNPGVYYGSSYSSSYNNLAIRLSFNIPINVGAVSYIPNESPYARLSGSVAPVSFSVGSFNNITTYPYSIKKFTRNIIVTSPSAGGSVYDSNKIVVAGEPILQYISSSTVPVLQRDKSIVSYKTIRDADTHANNIVGFYLSPTDSINDSIFRSIGPIDYQQYIGDPLDLYSSSYSELNTINKFYWQNYAYGYNINYYLSYVKTLFNVLFDQAKKLTPAKAKLLGGVVIEPHVLDRQRIPLTPIRREDDDILNLSAIEVTTQPTEVESSITDYNAIIEPIDIGSTDVELTDNIAILNNTNILEINSEKTNYDSYITISDIMELDTSIPDYDASIDIADIMDTSKFYVDAYYSGDLFIVPTYGPASDFDLDLGSYTYFTDRNGLVNINEITYIRNSLYNNLLYWTSARTYYKNDMVSYPRTYYGNNNLLSSYYEIKSPLWIPINTPATTLVTNRIGNITSTVLSEYDSNLYITNLISNNILIGAGVTSSIPVSTIGTGSKIFSCIFRPQERIVPPSGFTMQIDFYSGSAFPDILARLAINNTGSATAYTAISSSFTAFAVSESLIFNIYKNYYAVAGKFTFHTIQSSFQNYSVEILYNEGISTTASLDIGGIILVNDPGGPLTQEYITSLYFPESTKWYYSKINNFISNLTPDVDTFHWAKVPYTSTELTVLKKALLINGQLTLVDPDKNISGSTVVTGYLPTHWKFYKPTGTAFIRSRYTGCLQTIYTTSDGKDPVEILQSAADTLTAQPQTQILPSNNLSGPSLDVV